MPTLFQQIQAGKVWDFHGGIHPPSRKERTNQKPVALLDIPDRLYIPLRQHIGVAGKLLVKVGDVIERDDNLLTLETGKVALDIPSSHAGRVVEIHVTEGDTVDEGALLVTLEST